MRIVVLLHSVQWYQAWAQIFSYTNLILKTRFCFLILDIMVWSWHYLKEMCVLQNGYQMLWNYGQQDSCFKLRTQHLKGLGQVKKTSCHPPFFIRLIVQIFYDSLLTFMKQRESKPKLICRHICRKCLNACQKQKKLIEILTSWTKNDTEYNTNQL